MSNADDESHVPTGRMSRQCSVSQCCSCCSELTTERASGAEVRRCTSQRGKSLGVLRAANRVQ
jgi:hypothetical protein